MEVVPFDPFALTVRSPTPIVVLPDFPIACRRLTPGPGYLEALCEDNVSDERERSSGQSYPLVIIREPCLIRLYAGRLYLHPYQACHRERYRNGGRSAPGP